MKIAATKTDIILLLWTRVVLVSCRRGLCCVAALLKPTPNSLIGLTFASQTKTQYNFGLSDPYHALGCLHNTKYFIKYIIF